MTSQELGIIMISLDPGFFKAGESGDVIERHVRYSSQVQSLDIIVCGGQKPDSQVLSDRLTVHSTGVRGWRNIGAAMKIAAGLIRQKPIHLIDAQDPHGTGWIGCRLKKKYQLPLEVHFHGDFWNNKYWIREQTKNRIYNLLQKFVVQQADGIRVVSDKIKKQLVNAGVPGEKIVVIHTPVDDKRFTSLDQEHERQLGVLRQTYHGRKVILFCGRLAVVKNLFFLLDVVAALSQRGDDFVVLIIGDGPEKIRLAEAISRKNLGDAVVMLGGKNHQDLAAYYRLADFLVLLSTNESFGKVIIEAGLCGAPTLASATLGAETIIDDGTTGIIVPVNDLAATVDVANELLGDPEAVKTLGLKARQIYLERYSGEETMKKIISFWLRLANK